MRRIKPLLLTSLAQWQHLQTLPSTNHNIQPQVLSTRQQKHLTDKVPPEQQNQDHSIIIEQFITNTTMTTEQTAIDSKQAAPDTQKEDVEMNATADNSSTSTEASSSIPSVMDIVFDFNGSVGFAIGSSGFILAMYFENWLPYFRYGSLTWIWGSIAYWIPLFLKFKGAVTTSDDGSRQFKFPWDIADIGMFLCCLGYIVGCILGGFFDADTVDEFLPAINHAFLYGSFALTLEPLYQVYLFLRRKGSCRSRMSATKLCGTASAIASGDDDDDMEKTQPPLKFSWDRFFELNAMIFFCAAGYFGGFPPHPLLALPGVYCWEVGSLFSVARSFCMLHARRQGLKAQAAAAK
mmetsp:Transcript_8677/g.21163  ORF Transcript_8677/g.21163 Transcript_8677/m.21163 type:complete len:350 (+) Transcript_8677:25-1074(+)